MKLYLDTNYLLRYFTNDLPDQAEVARRIVNKSKKIIIPPIIIAETVYFLIKQYQLDKNLVCNQVSEFIQLPQIQVSSHVLNALQYYRQYSISFYDSLLLARVLETKSELKTFDEKLMKLFKKLKAS